MKIGFDVSQTGKLKAGCGYYADGLIRALAETDSSNEYILYPAFGDHFWDPECAISTFECRRINFRRFPAPSRFEDSRGFWENPSADFEERLGDPDILHSNNFFCPSPLDRTRLVYTLYDMSFLDEPSWSTEQNWTACFQGVFRASLFADFVVAISQYSKNHFLTTFCHFPESRTAVVYPASRFSVFGAAAQPVSLPSLQVAGFWLSVGTIEPRKNHARLLDAYRALKESDSSTLPLVLVGGKGWLMSDFSSHLHGLEVGRDIYIPGYLSDAELSWLYQNCFGFVYPSLFEGFGMPVLEALGLGAPVLCSNSSSLPEAGGDAAILFDPRDIESITSAMRRLADADVSRERLRVLGSEHAKRFSWINSARDLLDVYNRVAGSPRRG